MRRGWREVLAILAVSVMGTLAPSALGVGLRDGEEAPQRVALTVELSWAVPAAPEKKPALEPPAQDVLLEFSDGRVLEAVAWPWDAEPSRRGDGGPSPTDAGAWRLGSEPTGRVRLRIEAGLDSTLVVRRGEQEVRSPISAVLDRTQTVAQDSGLSLTLERVAWDVLAIDFGAGAEGGLAEPGAAVPVTIGYNILQPDAIDVTVRTTAVLRPIGKQEPVWQFEQRELLPANRPDPPTRIWSVPAPTQEGTYVLEVEAAWEATGAGPREGSRIGRLIRRRKPVGGASSALRRVVMVVLAPQSAKPSVALLGGETPLREAEIDSFDLSRLRGARFSAWGRSPSVSGGSAWEPPAEILAQASRHEKEREWLRGFIAKAGAEPGRLAAADERGLAWSAVSLHPALHPERPHRLTVSVAGGDPSALGALLIDPGSSDRRPKVLLDSCGVGSPAGKPGATTIEWLLWPGAAEPVLFLLNRHPTSDVTIGSVRLVELDPQPTDAKPPRADADGRGVGLHLAGRDALDRFSVSPEPGLDDPLTTAENLASYLATCGATFVVLPERLEDRPRRRRLAGRLYEDATGPDRLDLILRVLARNGVAVWIEPDLGRPDAFPELPPPDSAESIQQGLARIGATGEPDGGMYQPLHPRVREAIKRRIVEALSESGGRAGFAGVLVRLGRGPTLLGTPDTGMDDETFSRFVRETFGPEVAKEIPGLESTDPGRFEVRAKYLAGVGRMPWLTWRSKAVAGLYAELNEAARKTAPRSILALATPTLEDGPVGAEARRVDLAGLAPSQAWRSVGLDLEEWPKGPEAPVLFRGAGLSADDLARDLAVHPDLDEKLLPFSRRGVFLHAEHELVPSEGRAPLGGASGRITRPTATAPRPGTHLRSTSRRPTRSRRSTPDGSS